MLMALCCIAVAEAQPHRGLHPVCYQSTPNAYRLNFKRNFSLYWIFINFVKQTPNKNL